MLKQRPTFNKNTTVYCTLVSDYSSPISLVLFCSTSLFKRIVMNIQVNNLNLSLIEADIQRLFTPYGEISSVEIVRDRLNNRSKGKAVVKMPVEQEAQMAITGLQGVILGGKPISVNEVPNTDENRFLKSSFLK